MVMTGTGSSLRERALASAAEARLTGERTAAARERRLELAARDTARTMLHARFAVDVPEAALSGDYHGGYAATVDGLPLSVYVGLDAVFLTGSYRCGHPWESCDLKSVRDLGLALELLEREQDACPTCRHAE